MKNILTGIAFIAVISLTAWFFFSTQTTSSPVTFNTPTAPKPTPLSHDFQAALLSEASKKLHADVNQADANLLITVFPGFKETDFISVVTKLGRYEFRSNSLALVSEGTTKATGVEAAIADGGYVTLLMNTASRLNMPADSPESIKAIIETLKQK